MLRTLHVGARTANALVRTPDDEKRGRPALAPVLLLDGAFQALGAVLFQPDTPGLHGVARIAALTFHGGGMARGSGCHCRMYVARFAGRPPAAESPR